MRYDIRLEVITPLAVGAGNENEWVKGTDFVQYNGKLYVLDLKKALSLGIDMDKLNDYLVRRDEDSINLLLGKQLKDVSKYVFELPTRTDNPVKSFLRSQLYDKPLVPGSSLKGAIRSALFKYLRFDERRNEDVFGTLKNGADFMRFLKIGDVEMNKTILANSKIFNLKLEGKDDWVGGWKQEANKTTTDYTPLGFNTLYECVPPGEKGIGHISMDSNGFGQFVRLKLSQVPYPEKKKELMSGGIHELFKAVNLATKDYLRKERNFFSQFPSDRTEEIIDCIDILSEMIPDNNDSCIMKMSAGSGFHSITGDWQYEDYNDTGFKNGKKKYKSRKTMEFDGKLMLMGFVRISLLPEKEQIEEMNSLRLKHQELLDDIRSRPKKIEEMRKRILEEKRAAEEKELQARLIIEKYNTLIEKANDLYLSNHNSDALSCIIEAAALYPAGGKHQALSESIKKSLETEKNEQESRDKKAQFYSQPLSVVLEGKASVGNILGHLKKWLQEGNLFGDEEIESLTNSFKALPNKERRKLKGNNKQITNLVGEKNAQAIFLLLESKS